MTILDGKNPRFFGSVITTDSRWMIAEFSSGKPVIETTFLGTKEQADAISDAWNKREMAFYKSESERPSEKERPTLLEVARSLGIEV